MGCTIYTALQHYLWLSVFLWMLTEGIAMYISLVVVFGGHIHKFVVKAGIINWGKIQGFLKFLSAITFQIIESSDVLSLPG